MDQLSPESRDPAGKKVASKAPVKQSKSDKERDKDSSNLQQQVQDMQKKIDIAKAGREQAENKALRLEEELRSADERHRTLMERTDKLRKSLEETRREMAQSEARRKRDQLALNCVRLGKLSTKQLGPTAYGEVWEEGFALKDLNRRSAEHMEREEELQRRKAKLATLRRQAKRGAGADDEDLDLDLTAEDQAIKNHLEQLKKDKNHLAEERRLLESEKAAHQKELRRCQSEDRSRFFRDAHPCLNERYLLISLLGRGGFSEVWKALDLVQLKDVAIKVTIALACPGATLSPCFASRPLFSYNTAQPRPLPPPPPPPPLHTHVGASTHSRLERRAQAVVHQARDARVRHPQGHAPPAHRAAIRRLRD